MTQTDEIRATVLRTLSEIAPEVDVAAIQANVALRDQIDLDSMDLLNFLIAVDEVLGVEIPEADYGKIASLDNLVAYLDARMGAGSHGE